MTQLIAAAMPEGLETDEVADRARVIGKEQAFRIGVRVLSETAGAAETGLAFSQLAGLLLGRLHKAVTADARRRYGSVPGGRSAVIAMGKLGARELNVSSDIDLIFAYPEAGQTDGERRSISNAEFFTKLGQGLITALDQITADGFVFRVDMRLRPYGESGSLALNFAALEEYYQEQGRDWERYALIKARPVSGSAIRGAELMAMLRPFVFRRYVDFGVIESLRSMKGRTCPGRKGECDDGPDRARGDGL
jgi:glutamate-ammonia-ligase adenylyltransferase